MPRRWQGVSAVFMARMHRICLSVYRLTAICAVSSFWLLLIRLQWVLVYEFWYEHVLSLLLRMYLGLKLPGHMATFTSWRDRQPHFCFGLLFYSVPILIPFCVVFIHLLWRTVDWNSLSNFNWWLVRIWDSLCPWPSAEIHFINVSPPFCGYIFMWYHIITF